MIVLVRLGGRVRPRFWRCAEFYRWYNTEHHHSGIAMHRPVDVHYGHAADIQDHRGRVLADAYATHPERFVHHPPVPLPLPQTAWINRPVPPEEAPTPTNSTTPISN